MKHYKLICYILGGALFFSLGTLIYRGYESGLEGRERCKQKAEASLKSAAELWVNREFDKLGIPYSSSGGEPDVKSKKRRLMLAEGEKVVEVDSVKEAKLLVTSWVLSSKAHVLLLLNTPSVDLFNELWQKDMNGKQSYCTSALVLQSELPGDRKGGKFMAGDSTLMTDKFKLGTYYLDDMYFLELTAYLSVPSPWFCVDWGKNGIIACFAAAALCLCAFVLLFLHNRKKEDNDEANSSDDVVLHISEKKYKIGGVIFDEEACTLTFEDKVVNCTGQAYKLLSAFIHTKNHFLSNDRVVAICGWCPQHTGIDGKRRVTISHLRTLLDSEKSHVKIESGKNKQNELGFYLFVEKDK